mmetsp:Transcript_29790/g.54938  ORF Transcript_29790/g.54938 Transcript_29790/m.54938 type:complete len:553 (+) Transcript_29790:103-1761(+)
MERQKFQTLKSWQSTSAGTGVGSDSNSVSDTGTDAGSGSPTGADIGTCKGGVQSLADSKDAHSSSMSDLSRINRLEWRKLRRTQHGGMTSHSWLEAYLQSGRRLRIELFADGLSETTLASDRRDPHSQLYTGAATADELQRPMRAAELREVATSVANTSPYCLLNFNCHHFALAVWNAVVVETLQRRHYPDRVKTFILRGLEGSIGSWVNKFASLPSINRIGSRSEVEAAASPRGRNANASPQDGRRIWGEVSAIPRTSPAYNRDGRLQRFTAALGTGSVHMLQTSGDLEQMGLPKGPWEDWQRRESEKGLDDSSRDLGSTGDHWERFGRRFSADDDEGNDNASVGSSGSSDSATYIVDEEHIPRAGQEFQQWAQEWLPDKRDAAMRLAEHMGTNDLVELVARIIEPKEAVPRAAPAIDVLNISCPNSCNNSFSSVATQHHPEDSLSELRQDSVADVCYVVLAGQRELRVAIYALLRPIQLSPPDAQTWHLRLLSGDACSKQESRFHYTLQNVLGGVPSGSAPASAVGMARCELQSLQFGLATGDWNSVILM